MKQLPINRGLARRIIASAVLISFVATPPSAMAALTDIANVPPSSAASTTVPPNVLFILDASGSMDREYMPEEMTSSNLGNKASYASHLCNTVYYNPNVVYQVPKNSDGSDYANATFTGARNDGFLTSGNTGAPSSLPSGGTTNLSNGYRGTTLSGSEKAFYYQWTGAAAPTETQCQSTSSSQDASRSFPHTTTSGNWKKVQIAAAEEQNFANWFTYYRTRMLLMKSAGGRAFVGLPDTFRVGFITICPNPSSSCGNDTDIVTVDASRYLKIDGFTPAHKADWYAKFYEQRPANSTPLKQALSRAGRHFAGRTDGINAGMTPDPVQYSCQQNFTILTTDGFWNFGRGKTITGGTSGSADIGNHDNNSGVAPRPMFDGGPVTQTVTVTTKQLRYTDSSKGCPGAQRRLLTTDETITQTTTTPQHQSPNTTTNTATNSTTSGPCQAPPVVLPTPNPNIVSTNTTTTFTDTGSIGNTLADVAQYYYQTDLRGPGSIGALGQDVGTVNNVPPSGTGPEDDKATHQHMTTFTLGLGLDGNLTFDPNYKSQTVGDFADIRAGRKGWPNMNPGQPSDGAISTTERKARIDDLWHAAVNGRGQYFSAKNPTTLALSLQTALLSVQTRLAAAAAAATSTLEPTTADNLVLVPTYTTSEWTGELKAFQIDLVAGSPTYGQVLPAVVWSAQTKLDAKTKAACDNRTIKLFRQGALDNLVDFAWNTQQCDAAGAPTGAPVTTLNTAEQEFFTAGGAVNEPQLLSQWGLMTDGTGTPATIDQKTAAVGANLVNFIRGQRGRENFQPNSDRLYRERKHVLGDIVNSQPVYVRGAFFDYADAGYDTYAAAVAGRAPMVYAAANDGMLHAFTAPATAAGGEESWAFIPRTVLPRLYKLADFGYPNLHEYYVDGRPIASDVYDGTNWRTILVGGLNKGGRAYFALDVTDPAAPKALWEFAHSPSICSGAGQFADCHLGLSYGNPIITKLTDGRWVVLVTSGYNNVNTAPTTGDGQGYLYVLEAMTGQILYKIGTGAGDATTPSGLSKITAWVNDSNTNNTTLRVYGVDLIGNVWRFDINDNLAPAGREATRLATLKDSLGNPQPITVAPRLAEAGSPPEPRIYVGTGRYLATSDTSDNQVQSVYSIRDPLTPATGTPPSVYADIRASLRTMTLAPGSVANTRTVSCTANCSSTDGWFVDLIEPGERVNVPMELQLGTLVVASNVPANTACEPGGFSFINFFDFQSGEEPAGEPTAGYRTSGLTVGISLVRLPDGTVVAYRQRGDPPPEGTPSKEDVPVASGAPSGKRTSWREILEQ